MHLLKQFKANSIWFYSHMIQLISDANGILVFLKYLTEKYDTILVKKMDVLQPEEGAGEESNKGQLILNDSIYKVLKLMYLTCNGFGDKIRNNLLEYNAFVMGPSSSHIGASLFLPPFFIFLFFCQASSSWSVFGGLRQVAAHLQLQHKCLPPCWATHLNWPSDLC